MKSASARKSRPAAQSAKRPDWQSRLDEVQRESRARCAVLAQHHTFHLLDRDIHDARRLLDDGMHLLRDKGAPPLLPSGRTPVDHAVRLYTVFPHRLEPALAAVTKVAGGKLPKDLAVPAEASQALIKEMEGLRSSHRGRARRPIEIEEGLLRQIRALIDNLEKAVLTFYAGAKERYDLPALWRLKHRGPVRLSFSAAYTPCCVSSNAEPMCSL